MYSNSSLTKEDTRRAAKNIISDSQTRSSNLFTAGNVPDELVAPATSTVGKRLLQAMGWREGHGVGPRLATGRTNTFVAPKV